MVTDQPQKSHPDQLKVSLNLSKSEIDLIRLSWNRMLVEDTAASTRPLPRSHSPDMPGAFPEENELPNGVNDRHSSSSSSTGILSATSLASSTSLFCYQFYENLLSRSSNLEIMFPSLEHQATKFATVVTIAVMKLDDLSRLEDYLWKLGKRHSRILSIEPIHFEIMGEALIQTFHERFGAKFNKELEVSWIKLYLFLANSILQFGIDPVMDCEGPVCNYRVYIQPNSMPIELDLAPPTSTQNIILPWNVYNTPESSPLPPINTHSNPAAVPPSVPTTAPPPVPPLPDAAPPTTSSIPPSAPDHHHQDLKNNKSGQNSSQSSNNTDQKSSRSRRSSQHSRAPPPRPVVHLYPAMAAMAQKRKKKRSK